mgnify:CR=1 FL=1
MVKTRITIAGIGGVGGYFGGLLANHFYTSEDVEINFFARGGHLREIQKNGLKVIKGDREFLAKPTLATDNPAEMRIADFVIVAAKSYDLETIVQQLCPCIGNDTIILPLLNGVDSKDRIKSILPDNLVLDGCVYIVSRLKKNGIIENSGNIQKLYFGLDNFVNDRLRLLEILFKEANVEAAMSESITSVIWEKFIFISPIATATSYFDMCIGEIMADDEKRTMTVALIEEVKKIARAKQILILDDITERTLAKWKALPFEATSSMHSDFKEDKPINELESLTGYVINEGRKYNLETPVYIKAYSELKMKRGI